jgi:DNA-binding transcriptional ArsR family regulator
MNPKEERSKEAQILKALAHPIRVYIVETLLNGERCVGEICLLKDLRSIE